MRQAAYTPQPIKIAVCKKSAKTLEYLKIDESPVADKRIKRMQETCRALKRISILGNGAAVSRLLASYGNQLEWAYLDGYTEDGTRLVASACEETRFELNESLDDDDPESLSRNALLPALNVGKQLEKIFVNLRHRASDISEY